MSSACRPREQNGALDVIGGKVCDFEQILQPCLSKAFVITTGLLVLERPFAVMKINYIIMAMPHCRVMMWMPVRFRPFPTFVIMLMVFIMDVPARNGHVRGREHLRRAKRNSLLPQQVLQERKNQGKPPEVQKRFQATQRLGT